MSFKMLFYARSFTKKAPYKENVQIIDRVGVNVQNSTQFRPYTNHNNLLLTKINKI